MKESSLQKVMKLIKEDEYDDYEDDTSYSSYEYKNQIENYLSQIANSFNDISCYVEEEDDKFYLDFLDFKIFFDLDMNSGGLYINNITMYDRTDSTEAFKLDKILINALTLINSKPLNVSQQLQ